MGRDAVERPCACSVGCSVVRCASSCDAPDVLGIVPWCQHLQQSVSPGLTLAMRKSCHRYHRLPGSCAAAMPWVAACACCGPCSQQGFGQNRAALYVVAAGGVCMVCVCNIAAGLLLVCTLLRPTPHAWVQGYPWVGDTGSGLSALLLPARTCLHVPMYLGSVKQCSSSTHSPTSPAVHAALAALSMPSVAGEKGCFGVSTPLQGPSLMLGHIE